MTFWTRVYYFWGLEIIYYFGDQKNMWETNEHFGKHIFRLGTQDYHGDNFGEEMIFLGHRHRGAHDYFEALVMILGKI